MSINAVIPNRQAKDLQDSSATVSLQNEILHFVQDDNDRIGRARLYEYQCCHPDPLVGNKREHAFAWLEERGQGQPE